MTSGCKDIGGKKIRVWGKNSVPLNFKLADSNPAEVLKTCFYFAQNSKLNSTVLSNKENFQILDYFNSLANSFEHNKSTLE